MKPEPQYVAATLDWCNARRAEQGRPPLKRLPKGARFDSSTCPCGEATGLHVYHYTAWRPGTLRPVLVVPRSVRRFVAAFDSGRLPQYEAKR